MPVRSGRFCDAVVDLHSGGYSLRFDYHVATMAGVYEPFVDLGDAVEVGQLLGQVHALEDATRPPQPVAAQQPGLLIGVRAPARVERGDCLGVVARDLEPGGAHPIAGAPHR